MAKQVEAGHVLPMHHGTFRLSHEPVDEPIRRILAAAGEDGDRIVIREIGESWSI
jgi:L-ascorbate metabolism protein UlaG (beta-lactamase superfamily)